MGEERTKPKDSEQARAMQPRLLVISGTDVQAIELEGAVSLSLGRSDEADVTVDDAELSRLHARLHWGERFEVEDLGSRNGTIVRGQPIGAHTRVTVRAGETIEVGGVMLVLEGHGYAPQSDSAGDAHPEGIQAVYRVADRVANSLISVLLLGETGSGKGVLARRIHERSPRHKKRFLELNCAALPEQLLESELLGHERGAFTGAVASKPGLLELADGGTVFLDEVGELPLTVQAKLLRVIEERQVLRLGGREAKVTDVRFVAATNRDLALEVARGMFRSDLYYRLNGITLVIPPLRERTREIGPLAEQFLREAAEANGRAAPTLAEQVRKFLYEHYWPGNIRELRNVIHRAVVLCDGPQISMDHLFVEDAAVAPATAATAATAPTESGAPAGERERIIEALERFAGNQTKAARFLGMSRTTLSNRLDAYRIPRPRKPK